MNAHSADAALRACGAAIAALDAIIAGHITRAFCAVRPPGHHASASIAMGFCLFNAMAVAAAHALEAHGLSRVAIVDFDVHHGNGTQDIFATEGRVMYLSSHQATAYPGTGHVYERGVGNLVNAPLPAGCGGVLFRKTRSEEHTVELQSLMRVSYAVFCLKQHNQDVTQTCVCQTRTIKYIERE